MFCFLLLLVTESSRLNVGTVGGGGGDGDGGDCGEYLHLYACLIYYTLLKNEGTKISK